MSEHRKLFIASFFLLSLVFAPPSTNGATFTDEEVVKLAFTCTVDPDLFKDMAFSADGTHFAYAVDRDVRILALNQPESVRSFALSDEISSIALTLRGKYCLVALRDGHVIVWEVMSGRERYRHELADKAIDQMFVSADDESLLIVDSTGVAVQVPLLGGEVHRQPINPLHNSTLAMDTSADGRRLVTAFGPKGMVTVGFVVQRKGEPIEFPTSFGGHLNEAERLTYGQHALVAIEGRQWRRLYHPNGWKKDMKLSRGYFPLRKVLAAELDASDELLVAAGSRGRLSITNPGTFLKPSLLQLPIDTKAIEVDAACLSPECRSVAVCQKETLSLFQFGSALLFQQVETARLAEQLLLEGRFEDLEQHLAVIPVEDNDLFLECKAKLKGRYLSDEDANRDKLLISWIRGYPAEVMPRLVMAEMEMDLAWKIRGTGYASTVTDEMNQRFKEHAVAAASYLAEYVPNESTPQEYYLQQLSILTSIGPQSIQFRKATDALIEFRPQATDAHTAAITHLMPRWHGETGDGARYAERVADAIGGPDGEAMYMDLAAAMLRFYKPSEYFERTQFDPDRILATLDEQQKTRQSLPFEKKDHVDQLYVRFLHSNGDADAVMTRVKIMLFTGWKERNESKQKTHDAVMRAFLWAREQGGEADSEAVKKELSKYLPKPPNGIRDRK